MADQPVKDEKASGEHIMLKVVNAQNMEITFKIKRTTPFKKLMDAYAQRQGVNPGSIRFMFDGERLNEKQTPEELDMAEGDQIEVFQEQTGGSSL